MKHFFKRQNGFTGVDVAISIVLLGIFITVISTIFLNIYLSYTASQRNTTALAYATQIAELVDKLYFQDIDDNQNSKLMQGIQSLTFAQGYSPSVTVTQYTPQNSDIPNIVKIVNIAISYKMRNW